eukprot:CAMPEP_0168369050 /NCGR_PEP_ID=MMETSP0228-20121227/6562_1 /TAXON_ID=133427 /ORGANISM="Protoceratium reticulatum, Strain CCCM 535 (=CCMP 1889)" /LENGTH=104 /DNA_ID=CAMNT_0008381907 /DNA_START=150 /DNA_END=465 /DNA_ORIENTATION=-
MDWTGLWHVLQHYCSKHEAGSQPTQARIREKRLIAAAFAPQPAEKEKPCKGAQGPAPNQGSAPSRRLAFRNEVLQDGQAGRNHDSEAHWKEEVGRLQECPAGCC